MKSYWAGSKKRIKKLLRQKILDGNLSLHATGWARTEGKLACCREEAQVNQALLPFL